MSGAQIAVLAVVGFVVYKMYQRKKVEVGLEDLGGGLSDTDVEGYSPPTALARVRPTIAGKPTGLEGDQMMTVVAFKSTADFTAGATDVTFDSKKGAVPRTSSEVVPTGGTATGSGV